MYKIFLFLLFSRLLFANSLDKFHICTVATTTNYPTFFFLEHSARSCKIAVEVLGLDRPYLGNGTKFLYIREYLETLPDDDIVLFVDAYDVMIVQPKEKILKQFLSFNAPLVISAEKSCVSYPLLACAFDETKPFPYLNSGGYIGYVGALKAWIEALAIDINKRDQPQVIRHFAKFPEDYCIDTEAQLFLSLYLVDALDLECTSEGCRYKETGTMPSILHANGKSFPLLMQAYKHFVQNPSID